MQHMHKEWEISKGERTTTGFRIVSLLEFVKIYIFGSLPRTVDGNQYVFAMTERNANLTQAMPAGKTSKSHVTNAFIDFWIV